MARVPTEAQSEASRRNGSHSKGPITPHGKRMSAQNGRRKLAVNPRLIASSLLLPGESTEALESIVASLLSRFPPEDEVELGYIDIAVAARWRLARIWAIEQSSMIRAGATDTSPKIVDTPGGQYRLPAAEISDAWEKVHGKSNHSGVLQVSETRYHRQYNLAIQQLTGLQSARRRELEREPDPDETLPDNIENDAALRMPENICFSPPEPENPQYLLDFPPNREPENFA